MTTIYMPNIPRRKIYERMLVFEDGMIEMNVMNYNEENFEKFKEKFEKDGYQKIKSSYLEIKTLLVMFLEHRKYENEKKFEEDLEKMMKRRDEIRKLLWKNRNLRIMFKFQLSKLDRMLEKHKNIESYRIAKKLYKELDKFNSEIPKILELRRDLMK